MTELWYRRGTRSAREVQDEIDQFFADLSGNDDLQKEVQDAGLDPNRVIADRTPDAIRVRVHGAGLDPSMVALVVAFAPAVNPIFVTLWEKVLLPRIRYRHGKDAIEDERSSEP